MDKTLKINSLPFKINNNIATDFKFKHVTLNFNNAGFYKEAGYDVTTDFARRIDVLIKFMKAMAKDGTVIFNIQEITSRYMNAEEIRFKILNGLFEISKSWTATHPIGRHGDHLKCMHLMTFWNADVLHLNSMINFHFSSGTARDVDDQLCKDEKIFATSNALIMDMSLTVPSNSAEYHTGGFSIDNRAKYLNLNIHLPLRGPLKVKCLEKLFTYINEYPYIDKYCVVGSGDMNLFADEKEYDSMVKLLKIFGEFGPKESKEFMERDGAFYYESLTKKRISAHTFIPMKYDLKYNMKLIDPDKEPEKYMAWVKGSHADIKKTFNRNVVPLDWFIFKNKNWCSRIWTRVVDLEDLKTLNLGFDEWLKEFDGKVPDYGNFLSDHLPVVTEMLVSGKIPI